MIAPLDIDRMVLAQHVDDGVGTLASVENVADDMQMSYSEFFDEFREGDDIFVAAVDID